LDILNLSPKEAIELQKELACKVIRKNQFDKINYIAGVDVSNEIFKPDKRKLYASVVVLSFPELEIVEKSSYSQITNFPYIPGLLAFRESPFIIKALEKLIIKPDVIIVDGHGIAHPRKLGIASHIGVLTGFPTIGCAKSILVGVPEGVLLSERGNYIPLLWHEEIIGNVLRTKNNVAPVYVSIGHKINLEKATEIVLSCAKRYRMPEPTRLAHQYANQLRKVGILD
jgi:deoxyribonuclease V